ncbi:MULTISPECIES: AraC family transcriptional regulator [Catenuloplanes]|uniref:AraC-like DNA-binding protein n=1 Tax=Catenuloplanes niger TaxID=587534 RepID=A0AAE4A052_9ACTN|nr:AraC family transcriptional regulator [Catenuloplanes niger]MDR7327158.1 AraC-like DNA-binding protein [Catenuloplanes niger]
MTSTATTSVSDWQQAFADLHGAMRITVPDRDAPWSSRLEVRRTSSYGVAFCGGGRQFVSRQSRHIRADPRGRFELLVPLTGSAGMEQDRTAAQIGPEAMVLCDLDRPLTFTHQDDFRSIALIVPEDAVAGRSRALTAGSRRIDARTGLGRVVRQLVTSIHQERQLLSGAAFDLTCDRLLDLVCLAAEGGGAAAPADRRALVETEIRRYVRQHAAEPGLDVTVVARALGWSPRYLQQVLRDAGTTPRDLIRRERLLLARSRLASPAWSRTSIGGIARSCGFGSHASFTTAFRAEFGVPPRDARS